ncbi:hypothetical protein FJZ20_01580, partial [Candidatus Pacearchaeota archaeon]|nr:hypothetical protein [Candidatus Pacearchaeota archaeon]
MSGSVWYISFSKEKIEFKKYPAKKKINKKINKNYSKKLLINLFLTFNLLILLAFISSAEINDTFHLNIQTTYPNGTIETGTFTFAFNITSNSNASCVGPIVYNHSVQETTDTRGIVSLYLPQIGSNGGNLSSLDYDIQYYLCYYRNGTLKDFTQLGRVPYAFRATQVNLSEIIIDSNLTLGDFNVSAGSGFFNFLGSLVNRITRIFVQDIDISGDAIITGNLSVGTDILFVDSGSNLIGIGTVTPQNILNVIGDINATTTVYAGEFSGPINWTNLQNYPASCGAGQAVQVIGDTLTCVDVENATTLDGYPASFFMPLNASVYGNFDFNDGWTGGGLSIVDGNIFAQTLYVYNITSLDVSNLNLNGSLFPQEGFDNTFDIGAADKRWRDLYVGRDADIARDLDVGGDINVTGNVTASWFKGIFNWVVGTASQIYLTFNGTQLNFNETALNTTIDTRISDASGTLHVNISDYWNTGDMGALRNISEIYGSWLNNDLAWINFTEGDGRYILLTEESNLNVNKSEWWSTAEGDLDNVDDILGSWLTNDLAWINFTDGDGRYLLITDESNLNVNASDYWITDEGVKKNVADILGSEITNDLNWLNETTLAAAETDPYWTGNQSNYFNTTQILAFGYYNATDFVITDYFTKTEILGFGYYNETDFNITDYFTKTEVLAFNYYNASDFNISDYVDRLELLGYNYYNATDFNITDYFTKSEVLGFGYYNLTDFNISDYFTGAQILGFDYYNNTNFPYTHLSNFTDDILWTSEFNATADARYVEVAGDTMTGSLAINANLSVGTDVLFVDSNSDLVGIGTVSPQNKLNVLGDINATTTIYAGEFSGPMNWTNLQNYPVGCGTGQAVQVIGDTLTCVDVENATTLDGYPASFFMPLNTSVYGNFDFNDGWTQGGLSIVDGNIYAQTLYVYNITSLNVSHLNINGSLFPQEGFDNQFDIGADDRRWRDLYIGRDADIARNLDVGGDVNVTGNVTASWFKGIFNWIVGAASQIYLVFNGTQLDFNETALNQTIDIRISDSSGALSVNMSNYWNTGDRGALRNISQIYGSWITNDLAWINITEGDDRYILLTEESNLNVNRSEWWRTLEGDLDNVADILGSWLTNDLAWINFTQGDGRYILITDESNLNVNASDYWVTEEGVKKNVADILGSEITNDLGWINITQGDGRYLQLTGGTLSGILNMSGNRIISLANATDLQDAVTLSQLQAVNASATAPEIDPIWTSEKGNYSTTAEILAFGYYNATNFVITDYFTKTEILGFGYYNATNFNITDYFTSSEILAFNYYNASHFNISDYVGRLELLGYNYYNASDFNISDYYTKLEVYNKTEIDSMGFLDEEVDPYWTGNQSFYFNKTDILGFAYYNLTAFNISDYYLKTNPFGFWNDTYATFNKTYADTLYYGITNPYAYVNITTASNLNYRILSHWNNITARPTHLSNFTDDILWTSIFNATGDSRWLTSFTEVDPYWAGNYSTFLTHITWAQATNGTLA